MAVRQLLPAGDLRPAVNDGASLRGGARKAACIVQGMDAEAGVGLQAAEELRSPDAALLQVLDRQEFGVLAEGRLEEGLVFPQLRYTAGQMGERHLTVTSGPGIDAVADGQVAHEVHGFRHRAVVGARGVEPIGLDHLAIGELVRTDAGEPAVAARCAPAHMARFQHANVQALAGQFKGGGEPREARADDGDVTGLVTNERRRFKT